MKEVVLTEHLKTADLVERVKIGESTIRKYCSMLEKQGYKFQKDGDVRLFTSGDVEVIKAVAKLRESSNLSVQHAVGAVLATHQASATEQSATLPTVVEENTQHALQVKNLIEQLMMEREESKIQIQNLQQTVEEMSEKMSQMDEKMDELITTSRAEKHGKKPGFWDRLFNRS